MEEGPQAGFDPGASFEKVWNLPLVAGPSAEKALAAARRLDPRAEPGEIQRLSGLLVVSFLGPNGLSVRDAGKLPIGPRGQAAY